MVRDILHLKAPGNWINDPNGFIYFKGQYHMFYQYFPYAPVWGTMHWGHAVSRDLVHWEHQGTALYPTKDYDRNGIFSGSALELGGKLALYYSAVRYLETDGDNIHVPAGDSFETSQAMLVSADGREFDNFCGKRQVIPVVRDDAVADPTHTRDPKVWRQDGAYYMALGSTYRGHTGRVLFYRSLDGVKWEYVNQCRNGKYGRVIECPDIFEVDGRYVFAGCLMYILRDGCDCEHHAVCAPAAFDPLTCELKLPDTYQFIDYGLDFYAPQTNVDADGRRVMFGWMRMPQAVDAGAGGRGVWNGMFSLPRVVEWKDGQICFRVHPFVDQSFSRTVRGVQEIDFGAPFRLKAALSEGGRLSVGGLVITVEDGCLKADRSGVFPAAGAPRLVTRTPLLGGRCELDLFAEPNLIEIFVNGGRYVLSNVVYGLKPYIETEGECEIWEFAMMREDGPLR